VSHSRERGLATVEMAIALPLLIFLIFAVTEVGRAFVQYTVLANSVRNAARYLASTALLGSSGVISISDQLRLQAQNLAVYGNVNGAGSAKLPSYRTNQITVGSDASGNVSVTALYVYQPLFSGVVGGPGMTDSPIATYFNMQIVVTMRAL
jgi:Flp pilus assembly protein TadG